MKKYAHIPIVRTTGSNYSTKEFPVGFENILIISEISNQEIPLVMVCPTGQIITLYNNTCHHISNAY